jgi:tetratricopeptide (TPR) repeat protein
MWPRTTISADRGGVAAGRDAIVGISPEQLPAIIASAIDPLKKITDEQRAMIGELQNRLGANESQLQTFFRIIGEAGVAPEQVGERLVEIASRYKELLIQVDARPEDEPEVARLKAAAREALETGDLDQADVLLAEVEQLQDSALDRLAREAAATRVQRGEVALTRLRYREAAAHFATAAGRVSPGQEKQALAYLDQEAATLYRQGEEFGDNAALADAIARYRTLLDRRPRGRVPLDWAGTQHNLGAALLRLGERERGTARLEEAVAVYRAALEEFSRGQAPLQWAMTQNNLGTALATLGQREGGIGRLEDAVAAYRAALEEWTRERVPLQWAVTQNNVGTALLRLGERESGTARLEEAVAAYRAALEEFSRGLVPLQWGMSQSNLGNALWTLGQRESGTARLEEAVAAYRVALEERTRARVPLQ